MTEEEKVELQTEKVASKFTAILSARTGKKSADVLKQKQQAAPAAAPGAAPAPAVAAEQAADASLAA